MQNYLLLELELKYVRPHEIEKRLALARYIRDAEINRPGPRERVLLLISDLLISLGQGLKSRSVPLASEASVSQPMDCVPSGS